MDIENIAKLENAFEEFLKSVNTSSEIILYGAGRTCEQILLPNLLKWDVKPVMICDGNPDKWGDILDFKEYGISFEITGFLNEIDKYKNPSVIISSPANVNEIRSLLMKYVNADRIYDNFFAIISGRDQIKNYRLFLKNNAEALNNLYNRLADQKSKDVMEHVLMGRMSFQYDYFHQIYEEDQYFPKDIFTIGDDEVFIDGGAYTGDTIERFISECNNKFKRIFAYEPDKESYEVLWNTYHEDERIRCYQKGLGSKNEVLFFNDKIGGSSFITEEKENTSTIEVMALDVNIKEKVSFIKFDIEGSELAALMGCKNIIRQYRPKLAICLYHKDEDILEIPEYILSLCPDYGLYMRHYSQCYSETVLYAI